MKKLLLLLCFPFSLWGGISADITLSYDDSIHSWIKGEFNTSKIIQEMKLLDMRINREPDNQDKFYWKAKTALVRGMALFFDEKTDASLAELEDSQEFITKSLTFGDFSEGWRIMSESGSYIMLQKGVGYIISHSKEVQNQAEKSFELDEKNARASLIIAQGLINAPAIFGGNKKKGMALMETLSLRRDLSDEDKYFILLALSDVYKSNKRENDAILILNEILELYPSNDYVLQLLKELI